MAFVVPKETYNGKVYEVEIGTGPRAVKIGGENTLPFLAFEGSVPNKPVIAYEIQDVPPEDWPQTLQDVYKDVSSDPVKWAKHCQDDLGARMIALRLIGTHPDRQNRTAEEAAQTVKDVLAAIDVPLIILGSNNAEKDAQVLKAACEAAQGKNCLIGKAQEANYKTIVATAMAAGHKLVAMSDLDVNLAKQLNILITQMGFDKDKIVTDPMSSALGYGIEYTYSVMERIRSAALFQNDATMAPPMVNDVGMYVWKVKETMAPESDQPMWGPVEDRGIGWEATTAMGFLMAGSDLLIMRHPKAIETVVKMVDELV
jgi:acetyl-CoA decarbonylase/synthase, CODH/ACS complex subunit delta